MDVKPPARDPRPLMLGLGWFPDSLGGLDRYYRALLEALPGARGVVIGPAGDAPASVTAVAGAGDPLIRRLSAFRGAALAAAPQCDLIDAHFALYALPALRSRALRALPAVFHFHGPWADESAAAGDGSPLRAALRRALERAALHRAQEVVVLSVAFKRLLVERYGLRPWHIHAWPAGVDLELFSPGDRLAARRRLGLAESAFVAVCARRLVPRMGVEDLIGAWEALRGELPGGSTLLIAGEGPLRERLRERAGANGNVRVLGRVSEQELIDAYRAADVAVVPSRAFEGFGLVVLEAAACGTPSVVTEVGGLPEAVAGLDRSLVVPAARPAELRERLGRAARGELPSREQTRSFAERHRWDALADRHRHLYRRVLGGGRDERMRVVYLDHVARLSGGEIALLRLLPHLQRVNAHVILGEEGPLVSRLAEAGISVEVLPIAPGARDVRKDSLGAVGASPRASAQTLAYVARLTRRLHRLKPDLVHANSLKSGLYGGLAARASARPLLWHLRDRVAEDYLPAPAVHMMRLAIRSLADGVVANSPSTLETVARSRRQRVHCVIPDSVEPSPCEHAGGGEEGVTFGMLGRIAPWKGQDLFVRAFAAAFPAGPERAVIVGTPLFGEEGFERELRQLIDRLGLSRRIELRGFREDIWAQLAGIDVLVHASVIPEPFGQVVLEGMAAGLPVLAPDEGGPAAIIADGSTGRLFSSRDEASLARGMSELASDPQERRRLGAAALAAVADYHPDAIAQRLQDAYEQMLARTPR